MANPLANALQQAPDFLAQLPGGKGTLFGAIAGLGQMLGGKTKREIALAKVQNVMNQAMDLGLDPASAAGRAILADGEMFSALNPDDITGLINSAKLASGPEPAEPGALEKDVRFFERYFNRPLTEEEVSSKAGFSLEEPEKIRLLQEYERRYGRVPDDKRERFMGMLDNPATVQVINSAPDLDGVFRFLREQDVAGRQNSISELNNAAEDVARLIKLTDDPDAGIVLGVLSNAAKAGAAISELFGRDKAFWFFGPDIKTVGEARARTQAALLSAADIARREGDKRMSNEERRMIAEMLANPESMWTGPEQIRQAATTLLGIIQRIQRQNVQELEQGGVKATPLSLGQATRPDTSRLTPEQREKIFELTKQKLGSNTNPTDAELRAAYDAALEEVVGGK